MTKKRPDFIAEVSNNGLKVRLTLGREEMTLDAAEMDTIIRELAHRRSLMAELPPTELDPNAKLNPVMHPHTVVGDITVGELAAKRSLVLVGWRHPGYGWLAMTYSPTEANEIIDGMTRVLKQVDPLQTGKSSLILPNT